MDCPEPDDCSGQCRYDDFVEQLELLEQLIQASLDSKPLRDHAHRVANRHLDRALLLVDDIRADLFSLLVES